MDSSSICILVAFYAGLNILAFAVFSYDKLMAKVKGGRHSENSLFLIAFLGPTGALAAMIGFRHKIRLMRFFLVPVFFSLHMLLFIWLWPQIAG